MPNQKEYRIVINGISESIGAIDSLIAKINTLEEKITALNKSGITVNVQQTGTVNTGSQTQQAQQVAEVQKQITIEIDRQNEALRQQASFIDASKTASNDVLQIANAVLGTYGENIAKLDQLNQQLAANKQAQKEVADALKNEAIDAQTAAESRQRLLDEELRIKQARSEVSTILKNEVKMTQAQKASYDQMSQTLGRLRDALRASGSGLSPEQFEAVSRAIDKMDKELKEADKSVGNFQRNVGNYASAADGFSKITVTIAGVNREFESARSAIMELRNAMAQLVASGQQGTEAYKALEEQMKNLQLAMITVNDSIDRAKDASAGLHSAVEAIQGIAAIGSIGQGFASLFGIDDSALGEQIKKLTSLMAIMQGLQQLATQMATGTGIGTALKKVLDISGINNDWKQFKESLTVIGQRLGVVKSESTGAASSMGTFSLAAKTASAAASALGKSLAAMFAATGIIWAIGEAIDLLKKFADGIADALSVTRRMERANREFEASVKGVNEALSYQLEGVNRSVAAGQLSELDGISEKLGYIKERQKDIVSLYGDMTTLATKDIFGTERIKVASADYAQLEAEITEIQKLLNNGLDPKSWVNALNGEKVEAMRKMNDTLSKGVGDIAWQWQQVDKTSTEAISNWAIKIKESEHYQRILNLAIEQGDDFARQAATSFKTLSDNIYEGAVNARDLKNEMAGMAARAIAELEAFQKYGLKNMGAGGTRDQRYNMADFLFANGKLTKEQVDEYKKYADTAYKEQTSHNRKVTSAAKKTAYDLTNIEKQIQADKIAAMRDGLTKTLATIEEERRARLDAIKKYPTSKQEEARAAANALYDQKALDAQKEFHDKYAKEEEEFNRRIERLNNDVWKSRSDNTLGQRSQRLDEYKEWTDNDYINKVLKPMTSELRSLAERYDEIDKAMKQVRDDYYDIISAVQDAEQGDLADFDLERWDEYTEKMKELNDELEQVVKRQTELSERQPRDQQNWNYLDRDVFGNFATEEKYYFNILSLQEDFYAARRQAAIDNNESERLTRLTALENEFKDEEKALKERWGLLLEDEAYLKEHGMTRLDAEAKHEADMANLREVYQNQRIAAEMEFDNRLYEIEKEYTENDKKLLTDYYSYVANSYGKMISSIEKMRGRIEKESTNAWGIVDTKKMRRELEEMKNQYRDMEKSVMLSMENLREDFAAGWIDPVAFNSQYQQLKEYRDQVRETLGEIDDDIKNIPGKFWKGIDEWIQQVAQSFQQVLSAIFDYQNGEFDRMQEAIDRELEIVQKKYDEMEELAQKHKDAMNEIEDELSTARGDRRAHLVDALSAEIQAQRDALAAQRKAEKEKETLEKKADKLELQRKKQQRKQNIIQAILNGALAISQAAKNDWPAPAIPLMALAAAATAAQVAIMSKTHYAKGGLLEGKSHAQGGIPVGNTGIEVEGNEFVTNKKTTMKNLDLLYYINSKKRELDISDFIDFYTKNEKTRKPIISNRFADGGLTPNIDLAERLVNVVVERDNREIVVSVVDINRAQQRVAQVEQLAGLQ